MPPLNEQFDVFALVGGNFDVHTRPSFYTINSCSSSKSHPTIHQYTYLVHEGRQAKVHSNTLAIAMETNDWHKVRVVDVQETVTEEFAVPGEPESKIRKG